jgi:hypothetical protein
MNPEQSLVQLIEEELDNENSFDIWKNSPYKNLIKLQSNNVGKVGEKLVQRLCENCDIKANINGVKTKKKGGGAGDGTIKGRTVEIKTAHQGSKIKSFQHEYGEVPWKADYMIHVDISPQCIYLTIFKNFSEEHYKGGMKCGPYFPSKKTTWRKGTGCFKLDTTVKINEENILRGITFKLTEETDYEDLEEYINDIIKE